MGRVIMLGNANTAVDLAEDVYVNLIFSQKPPAARIDRWKPAKGTVAMLALHIPLLVISLPDHCNMADCWGAGHLHKPVHREARGVQGSLGGHDEGQITPVLRPWLLPRRQLGSGQGSVQRPVQADSGRATLASLHPLWAIRGAASQVRMDTVLLFGLPECLSACMEASGFWRYILDLQAVANCPLWRHVAHY